MSSNIQHTLLNLEITPPSGAWSAIADRLDVEYDATDTTISQKMTDWEIAPPVKAWENIQAGLSGVVPEKKRALVIPFRKVAVAAALLLAAGFIAWYFLLNSDPGTGNTSVAIIKPSEPTPIVRENNPRPSPAASFTNITARPLPKRPTRITPNVGFGPGEKTFADNLITADIPTASPKDIRAINTINSPAVAAPLIRDKNGNIILDKSLITKGDYIIVTGPNGEQTRMSTRFMQMLSSMNGDPDPSDYLDMFFHENSIWKYRFRDWREKLLKKASYIPTGTNFFDIAELQDIIKD